MTTQQAKDLAAQRFGHTDFDEFMYLREASETMDGIGEIYNLAMDLQEESFRKDKDLLMQGASYSLGDFRLSCNEETGALKVTVVKPTLRLTIEPNTDNSCTLVAKR